MNRTEEVEAQVQRLTDAVSRLQSRLAQLEGENTDRSDGSEPSSRRAFLRLGSAAALGAVGAVALRAAPAAAADLGNVVIGQNNLGETTTSLKGDNVNGGPHPVLAIKDDAFTGLPNPVEGLSAISGPLQGLGPGTILAPVVSE